MLPEKETRQTIPRFASGVKNLLHRYRTKSTGTSLGNPSRWAAMIYERII